MATIKSYTDLEQSKKLAEILPLESADLKWFFWKEEIDAPKPPTFGYSKTAAESYKNTEAVYLPCWSLAALLNIIQKTTPYKLEHYGDKKVQLVCVLGDKPWELVISDFNNEVDACVEMILKLYEEDLL